MSNMEEIRLRYSVDQIKAIFYSMMDSMWDLAFNYNMCHQSKYTFIASYSIARDKTPDWTVIRGIIEQMRRDTDLVFKGYDFADVKKLIEAFVTEFYDTAMACIRAYVGGPLIKGRLYPEEVATNGVAKAYLFLHEKHPKWKLNRSAKDYVETIVDGVFAEKRADDKGYLGGIGDGKKEN